MTLVYNVYKFSSALRATGRENGLNPSSQDIQRVSPTGPKLLDTLAKEEALSFLKMEGEFLRQKKKKKSFSSLGKLQLCLTARLSLYYLLKASEALVAGVKTQVLSEAFSTLFSHWRLCRWHRTNAFI